MADTSNLSNYLKDVADAIREKKGTEAQIPAANFDTEILSIESGMDTSDATALSSQILQGKTAYANNEKITGTLTLDTDQIAVGTDEVKVSYIGVPNDMDVSYDNKFIQWVTSYNGDESFYNCFYSINVPYIFTYYQESSTKIINVYDKEFNLLSTIDFIDDIGASSSLGSPWVRITASMINGICYVVIYGENTSYTTKIGVYKQTDDTNEFTLVSTINNMANSSLVFDTVQSDRLVSIYNGNVYKLVNDTLVKQSYSFGGFEGDSDRLELAFTGDYIFTRTNSTTTGYNKNIRTTIKKCLGENTVFSVTSSNILDVTASGKLARYDNTSKKIKFYTISDDGSFQEKSYFIDNSFYANTSYYYPTVRFIDDNTILTAVTYGNRYEGYCNDVKFQLIHIGEDGVNVIKEVHYTNPNNSTQSSKYILTQCRFGQIYENQYLFLSPAAFKSYTVDLRELVTKVYNIEDKNGVKYYPYDNAAQLDDLGKVLENSGTVIYKNGIGSGTMPNNGALEITPSAEDQTIPEGYTSGGKVSGDIDLKPENIKAGVTIFGVEGIVEVGPITQEEYEECLALSYQILGTEPPVKGHIYGIKRLRSSIDTAWERTDDNVGKIANATKDGTEVQNDFDNLYPWSDIISFDFDSNSQSIIAYYGDDNFTFSPSDTNINVFTKIPQFWYKRWIDEDDYEHIQIADYAAEGFLESKEFAVARYSYEGSTSSPRSCSGLAPLATSGQNYQTGAKSLGNNIYLFDWRALGAIQFLYLVEYANNNSQDTLGKGISSGSMSNSGQLDSLGMKSGCLNNDAAHSVMYRGIEDIFGNVYQLIDGVNINNDQAYVCTDPTKYEFEKYDGDYAQVGYVNSSSNGCISKLGYDENYPLLMLPIECSGVSDTTGFTDYYYRGGNKGAYRFRW